MRKLGAIVRNKVNGTTWVVVGGIVNKNVRLSYASGYNKRLLLHYVKRYLFPLKIVKVTKYDVLYEIHKGYK